jgi:hypothetical protein
MESIMELRFSCCRKFHIISTETGLHDNEMSTDRENGRGNKRARIKRGKRNPKHSKRKHYIVHQPSISN